MGSIKEMKMKNSNDLKTYQALKIQENQNKKNDPGIFQMSLGSASGGYENTTESNDDIAMVIQEAMGRDVCLSLVVDNIHVRVEGEIVTLEGEVFREEEKITAGDIATACAGYDKVNNYLDIIHSEKSESTTRRLPW